MLYWGPKDWAWRRSLRKRVSLTKPSDLLWARQTVIMQMDLDRTRDIEVIPSAKNGGHAALLWETGEFDIVYVSLDRRVPKPRRPVSLRKRVSLVRRSPRLVRDALGLWDPAAVDWSEPALYHETAYALMPLLGQMVDAEDRLALAGSIADYALAR